MSIQIANPVVVAKIERLAKETGQTKTAAVEQAVDAMLSRSEAASVGEVRRRMDAILAQIDRVPDLPAPFDPFDWDEHGLPR